VGKRHRKLTPESAVDFISRNGVLLVFPINNRQLPRSLWSQFFPDTPMIWDWNEDADHRVSDMWSLMKGLSGNRAVVYSKWYQGRATFFSRELFTAMLCVRRLHDREDRRKLDDAARQIMEVLENNSPLSTRKLKELTDLQGRLHESAYSRSMKMLFSKLMIVGFGEVDDGAFPSLAVGATELLYDDLFSDAEAMPIREAQRIIDHFVPVSTHFRRFWDKTSAW
jgi:hypothetical protein